MTSIAQEWPGLLPLALGACVFLLGGLVKGTLGIGLPLVAVPLLALGGPTVQAIALVSVPVLASNLWQAWDSGISRQGVRRFLPLIVALLVTTMLTVHLTLALPESVLRTMVAVVMLIAITLTAAPLRLNVPPARERWWSAGVGALSGVLGGVSSLMGPVIISYLMSLGLKREVFVGTISVIYLCGALPLYGGMALQGRFTVRELLLSLLAMVPVALGMKAGKWVRQHLSELLFRRVLLGFLVAVAAMLIFK